MSARSASHHCASASLSTLVHYLLLYICMNTRWYCGKQGTGQEKTEHKLKLNRKREGSLRLRNKTRMRVIVTESANERRLSVRETIGNERQGKKNVRKEEA